VGTRVGSSVSLVDARAMLLSDGPRQGHWRDLVACSGLHGLLSPCCARKIESENGGGCLDAGVSDPNYDGGDVPVGAVVAGLLFVCVCVAVSVAI